MNMLNDFPIIEKAAEFAEEAHKGQVRKYTGEPYFNHCREVAGLVRFQAKGDPAMVAAAYLHDTVEDCGISNETIEATFGEDIAELVAHLTDVSKPSDGNRVKRKEIDRQHTFAASPRAKTVKLADLISNSKSIAKHDPGFAKVYMEEKRLLLDGLKEGDANLYSQAKVLVDQYFANLACVPGTS